jgi:hypothetical protein
MSMYYVFVCKYITLFHYPDWLDLTMGLQPYKSGPTHLAAHATANPGRLPTRTRPETQQSGPHWPFRERVRIYTAGKRICDSIASLAV